MAIAKLDKCPLPANYSIRPLEVSDYEKGFTCFISGFLQCLAQLTEVGQITKDGFESNKIF